MTIQLGIDPPLVNSSNPWATTIDDLRALYECPFTGAVTTRTSLLGGFTQHPTTHQYTFFSTAAGHATSKIDISGAEGRGQVVEGETSSLNNLGYSPILFNDYVAMVVRLNQESEREQLKPFIISVTGTAIEVSQCYRHLIEVVSQPDKMYPHPNGKKARDLKLLMEINLSCPNIPDKPPPAYDGASLATYINSITEVLTEMSALKSVVPVGIKTPPYTYSAQFQTLLTTLEASSERKQCPISFITATNTLGNCFVPNGEYVPALDSVNGSGIGGMAGDAIHPLALGNVKSIRELLDKSKHEDVRQITIIGVGGVRDANGFKRMRSVGASLVGVGTAFGRGGIDVFQRILQ